MCVEETADVRRRDLFIVGSQPVWVLRVMFVEEASDVRRRKLSIAGSWPV